MQGAKVKIAGVGMYVPEKVLTNFDLEKMVDTNDEWITTRTGIKERRIAEKDVAASDLGVKALEEALRNANMDPKDLEMIIVATITPDMIFPATAYLIASKLGIQGIGGVDIEAACSGFVYGLSIGVSYIKAGIFKNVAVVASEVLSKIVDWADRNTCVLFGDGAGAVILTRNEDPNDPADFLAFDLGGDGSNPENLYIPAGGSLLPASEETVKQKLHYIKMNGRETFKNAVRKMPESLKKALEKANVKPEDLKLIIPHQANIRITEASAEYLQVPMEKVYSNIHKYGNTSAASIPIALYEAIKEGKIQKGDIIGLMAFGGGFSWGSTVFIY